MVPSITHLFVKNIYGEVPENYTINARTDRYKIMCSIFTNEKKYLSYVDDGISSGDNALPSNDTTEALFLIVGLNDLNTII